MDKNLSPRRRFLAGSAALPVILTVQSGSALAAASATCRAKDAAKEDPTLLVPSESADEWMRATIQLVTLKVDGQPFTGPGGQQVFFRGTNDSLYYEYFDNSTPPTPVTGLNVPVPNATNVEETPVTDGTRLALIHVDEAGNPTGFAWEEEGGGQKLTNSCWTSFK